PHHVRRTTRRQDHRRQRRPALASAGKTLLAGVGDGARNRLVGAAPAISVVHKGAKRRAAAGCAPTTALLRAYVGEVGVDRDCPCPHPLPGLKGGVNPGRWPQSLACTGSGIVFATCLIPLVAVYQ